ncbi:hypothetical protein GCM10020001_067510 [Nonomuraea salmonea]
MEAIKETLAGITAGDPWDPATDIGPLISAAHRDRVHGFVERAGGRVPHGGSPIGGAPAFFLSTHACD